MKSKLFLVCMFLLICMPVISAGNETDILVTILSPPEIMLGDNEFGDNTTDDDGTAWATLTTDPQVASCEINWEGSWENINKNITSINYTYSSGGLKTVYYKCYDSNNNAVTVNDSILVGIDADGDGYTSDVDCDDADPLINPGATEVCDGLDNNCDGQVDEGCAVDADGDGYTSDVDCDDNDNTEFPGQVWYADCDGDAYYRATEVTSCDVAEADALTPCTDESPPDGGWSHTAGNDCDDEHHLVYPGAAEVCNGLDDDCNAATADGADETWYGDPCDGGDSDLCTDGNYICGIDSQFCDDRTEEHLEVCDDLDNDCDGVIDDGFDLNTDENNCGYCGNACAPTDNCIQGVCSSECIPDDTRSCEITNAHGTCTGIETCDGGEWGLCSAQTPQAEVCDSLDNECDGVIDEGFPSLGEACGEGVCVEGTFVCSSDGLTTECSTDNLASAEVCDGLDNDCDGEVDEGNPGGGGACDTGGIGVCKDGTQTCTGGELQCVQNTQSSAEVCDYLDNDCDGAIDEGCVYCFGILDNDPSVCSGNGICTAQDTCQCISGWIGTDCATPVCTQTCVHGTCTAPDTCTCDEGWAGEDCSIATEILCNGIDDDNNPATPDDKNDDGDPVSYCDGDCDDNDAGRFPGNNELCDAIDQDCDGSVTDVPPSACDDGIACTTNACDAPNCVSTPVDEVCDDGDMCTDDSCSPATGCVNTDNTNPCDDQNACTIYDTCSGGYCVGGPPLVCNDGNPCTDDSCSPASGCMNIDNTAVCEDGNACTIEDMCSSGACIGGPPPDCNDNNPCTDDSCDTTIGCMNPYNNNPCEDGDACTTDDMCSDGECGGSPLSWIDDPCDGGDTDLCNEGVYSCTDGSQICNDYTGNNLELCNAADDDCNAATADGYDESWFGDPCDGADSDLCTDGNYICEIGSQFCDDSTEEHLEVCDGLDNDCDGAIDEDGVCGTCSDGIDNDGDGWIDIEDPDCAFGTDETGFGDTECNDGVDNDEDGWVDSNDPECIGGFDDSESTSFPPECQDGMDNDGDGWVDMDDPDCSIYSQPEQGFSSFECNDGVDNDGDFLIDVADSDCDNAFDDNEESVDVTCIDSDSDSYLGYDPINCPEGDDCDDNDDTINPGAIEICDGIDNDCDGLVDEGFDQDSDGIADCFDNCPNIPNADQSDADGDDAGDSCDDFPQDPDCINNNPPESNPNGLYILNVCEGLTLDASGSSDPDMGCGDSIEAYEWDLNNDGIYEENRTENFISFDWVDVETLICDGSCVIEEPFPITLRVTDSLGATDETTTTLTIYDNLPIADLNGPYEIFEYEPLQLDGSQSYDPNEPCDSIVEYSWDIDEDGLFDDAYDDIVNMVWEAVEMLVCGGSCIFESPYTIALRVTDSYGLTDASTTTLVIHSDTDGDGFLDLEDNCPNDYNPDQADCNDDGAGDACDAINPTADEVCDNVDNDCDGSIDEDLTQATTCGVGACSGNTGEETCSAGSWIGDTCDPLAGSSAETCDNIDNDCDGAIDEGGDALCDDGLFCNGDEVCQGAEGCQLGTTVDCSGDNLAEIATCNNNPDNNTFTYDYFAGFTSACDEEADVCTTETVSLTHTCDKTQCSAECESNTDCDDSDVHTTDSCSGCACEYQSVNNDPTIDSYTPSDTTPGINEGESLTFSVTASDLDGDELTYSWKLDDQEVSTTTSYTYSPGYEDSGSHVVTVTVSDSFGTDSQQWDVSVNEAGEVFEQSLAVGWNTVTLTVHPFDTAVASVLSSIEGKYDNIWAEVDGEWLSYSPTVLPLMNTLTYLDETTLFYIEMNQAAILTVIGTQI